MVIWWLHLRVFDHCLIAICPIHSTANTLDIGIGKNVVGVRAALTLLKDFGVSIVSSGKRSSKMLSRHVLDMHEGLRKERSLRIHLLYH